MRVSWSAPESDGSQVWRRELKWTQPSELRSWEAILRQAKGSALAGGLISVTLWPAALRAATVVETARSIAGVGGTTPVM